MQSPANIERRVGVFIFAGILVTCALIVHFGKVGDRFRGGYPVTVEFSNAGGLVRGAQVLYAGVLVGKVNDIALRPGGDGVSVDLTMFEGAQVRNDARFMIKQSGLLGDQHIVIAPVSTTAPFLKKEDVIKGVDPFDFSDAASQAGDTIRKLNEAINKLSSGLVEKETIENLKRSIKNFAELTAKLQRASEKLDTLLTNAQKGQGTVGKLLTDDRLFEELRLLVHNWRVYGILHQEKSEQRYPSPRNKKPEDTR